MLDSLCIDEDVVAEHVEGLGGGLIEVVEPGIAHARVFRERVVLPQPLDGRLHAGIL